VCMKKDVSRVIFKDTLENKYGELFDALVKDRRFGFKQEEFVGLCNPNLPSWIKGTLEGTGKLLFSSEANDGAKEKHLKDKETLMKIYEGGSDRKFCDFVNNIIDDRVDTKMKFVKEQVLARVLVRVTQTRKKKKSITDEEWVSNQVTSNLQNWWSPKTDGVDLMTAMLKDALDKIKTVKEKNFSFKQEEEYHNYVKRTELEYLFMNFPTLLEVHTYLNCRHTPMSYIPQRM
jgi:hypothetical protein